MIKQRTLKTSVSTVGVGLHKGEKVQVTLRPAPANTGIVFRRVDLDDQPFIDADVAKVQTVERATTLAEGSVKVHTVEHILSALCGMGVDNALIEMDANEPPIGDGSSKPYVELIKQAGIVDKGMIPKVDSAVTAVRAGVEKVSFVDGRVPHSVLMEIFTDEGVGTEVVL